MRRIILTLLMIFTSAILFAASVNALGIGPAKTSIPYSGAETRQVTFHIFRERPEAYDVRLEVEGILAPYIELPQKEFTLSQEVVPVPFTIKIPDNLPPGENDARIFVTELASSVHSGDSIGLTQVKIPHKVIVDVPYPDKHVDAQVRVQEEDKDLELVSTVQNTGALPLSSVKADFEVFDQDRSLTRATTQETSLSPHQAGSLSALIDKSQIGKGVYETLATIHFDDQEIELTKSFQIGKPTVILSTYEQYFAEEEVNSFPLEVYNDWNRGLEDLFIEVVISKDGKEIDRLKTFSFGLRAGEQKVVETHWDTRGLEKGTYDATIITHVGRDKQSRAVTLEITSADDARLKQKGGAPGDERTLQILLIGVMGLFALALIGLLIILYRLAGNR